MTTKIEKFETKTNHTNSAISANLSADPLNHRNIEQEFMVNADGGVYLGNLRKGDKITINKAPEIEKPAPEKTFLNKFYNSIFGAKP